MTHRTKRCAHCKIVYAYQSSGEGCHHEDNNDTYCPDCMHEINKALSKVPVKFESVVLPTVKILIEEFEKKYKEHEKKVMESNFGLMTYQVRFGSPTNFSYKDLTIDNLHHTLIENKDTGEKLLECKYEQDYKTKEITGYYYEYR